MLKPSFAATAAAVLVTLAGGLFVAGDAHARAIYKGTFDPRGDVYGFSGKYTFVVDPACLITDGFKTVNGFGDNPCGNAVLIGGELTLRKYARAEKDANDNYVDNTTVLDLTFDFSTAEEDWISNLPWNVGGFSGTGGMASYIYGINVVENQLFGVDTPLRFGRFGPFDEIPIDPLQPTGLKRDLYWALEWFSGLRDETAGDRGVKLFFDCPSPFTPSNFACNGDVTTTDNPSFKVPLSTKVTFERVPEPGSLALVAAALMAASLGVRQARRG